MPEQADRNEIHFVIFFKKMYAVDCTVQSTRDTFWMNNLKNFKNLFRQFQSHNQPMI